MSSIPNQLDPPKGDYVAYIEKLQQGKIKVPEGITPPKEAGEARRAIEIGAPTQPQRRSAPQRSLFVRAFGPVMICAAIGSIAGGLFSGQDAFIPIGMFILFIGFVLTAELRK